MSEEKPLHVRVAEALGWTAVHARDDHAVHPCGDILLPDPERMRWKGREPGNLLVGREGCTLIPRYDTDWSATGPLIEKYNIELTRWNHATGDHAWWRAEVWGLVKNEYYDDELRPGRVEETKGYERPLEAVCNLILALKEAGKLPAPTAKYEKP